MKNLITLLFLSSSIISFAQSDSQNLVPNPSFEETGKSKVKNKGQIEYAEPWKSATMEAPDLYMSNARNDEFAVPENAYGKEKPKSGENYAGVSFFGYRGRMPRTYLQTELKDTLEAGKEYCMKFHVSLSDMSKYAVNNLGMYVSSGEIDNKSNGSLEFEPQIRNLRNRVFNQQFLWEPICGIYKAKGDETHIVIGNFSKDEQTDQEKIRLSREFSGRQADNAYYFIDDVTVVPITESNRKDCMCDKIAGGTMEVEYKSFGTKEEERAKAKKKYIVNSDGTKAEETISKKEKEESVQANEAIKVSNNETQKEIKKSTAYNVNNEVVLFDPKSSELNAVGREKLDKLADYLKKNKKVKVEIQGHADPSESEVAFIGKRRAFEVVKYLNSKGIDRAQIPYKSFETEMPAQGNNASSNARVSFQLK